MVGDEHARRPQADDDPDVEHQERGDRDQRGDDVLADRQDEKRQDREREPTGEPPAPARAVHREPRPNARPPVPQVAAVVPGSECQHDADNDHPLAGATESADEHVDELGDGFTATGVVGRGRVGERRRRRADAVEQRAHDGEQDAAGADRVDAVLDFQITSASSATPIRNIGM